MIGGRIEQGRGQRRGLSGCTTPADGTCVIVAGIRIRNGDGRVTVPGGRRRGQGCGCAGCARV